MIDPHALVARLLEYHPLVCLPCYFLIYDVRLPLPTTKLLLLYLASGENFTLFVNKILDIVFCVQKNARSSLPIDKKIPTKQVVGLKIVKTGHGLMFMVSKPKEHP
jgi:hypothetical protein